MLLCYNKQRAGKQNRHSLKENLEKHTWNYRWSKGNWISNTDLYKLKQIKLNGQRLPEGVPAKVALYELTRDIKKPKERTATTLLKCS